MQACVAEEKSAFMKYLSSCSILTASSSHSLAKKLLVRGLDQAGDLVCNSGLTFATEASVILLMFWNLLF
jgi:hypothetical protein